MAYVIRTPTGYVGRIGITAALRSDVGEAHAYTYDTVDQAEWVAKAMALTDYKITTI